jgi:hypothetical protein
LLCQSAADGDWAKVTGTTIKTIVSTITKALGLGMNLIDVYILHLR